MPNEIMTMDIAALRSLMSRDTKWLQEASCRLSQKRENAEDLLAIPDNAFTVGMEKAGRHLISATPTEIASCIDVLSGFCSCFGIPPNQTAISFWTKVLIGKPTWAIRIGIDNMAAEWKWATKLPLPSELSKACDDVPEYAIIRKARADMEIAFARKKMLEDGAAECRRRFDAEKTLDTSADMPDDGEAGGTHGNHD